MKREITETKYYCDGCGSEISRKSATDLLLIQAQDGMKRAIRFVNVSGFGKDGNGDDFALCISCKYEWLLDAVIAMEKIIRGEEEHED